MTLVARAVPPAYHKKLAGKHHRQSKTYHKTYWPYLPLLLIVLGGLLFNTISNAHGAVLGYATDMSVQSLLDDTNDRRQANNEAPLAINQVLINAAQAKASDMAARNYWSHNTPDGQTPWTFMTAAGYNYELAGENLAYGFATAEDTLTGWMNSPGHRANILKAGYTQVGFGYVNIANYQNDGPETLVVAMYGSPASAPLPVTGLSPSSPQPLPAASGPVAAAKTAAPSPAAAPAAPLAYSLNVPAASNQSLTTTQTAVVTPAQAERAGRQTPDRSISRVQLLTAGKAPWSVLALSVAGGAALVVFLFRHALAWHKILRRSEQYLLHHPWLDALLVAVITAAVVLTHSSGVIR